MIWTHRTLYEAGAHKEPLECNSLSFVVRNGFGRLFEGRRAVQD